MNSEYLRGDDLIAKLRDGAGNILMPAVILPRNGILKKARVDLCQLLERLKGSDYVHTYSFNPVVAGLLQDISLVVMQPGVTSEGVLELHGLISRVIDRYAVDTGQDSRTREAFNSARKRLLKNSYEF